MQCCGSHSRHTCRETATRTLPTNQHTPPLLLCKPLSLGRLTQGKVTWFMYNLYIHPLQVCMMDLHVHAVSEMFFAVGTQILHADHLATVSWTCIDYQFKQCSYCCLHQNVKDYKRDQGGTAVKAVTFIEGETYVCKSQCCIHDMAHNNVPIWLFTGSPHIVPP